MSDLNYNWALDKYRQIIRTCRTQAVDGTILFTPDGVGHYGALWTRDFAYLVEHGADFLDQNEVRAAIKTLLAGQREDGAMPDRVNQALVPIYFPGSVQFPMGRGPALDNGMFMVALVYHYHAFFKDPNLVRESLPALRKGMAFIPRNRGLVFNDPQHPSSTYGFQDAVSKGGHDLFCSLLWIVTCRRMAILDPESGEEWKASADAAEKSLWLLWDESKGAYLAANEVCRQIDVWGNAYLVAHQIGDAKRREQVAHYLAKNHKDFVYQGQVRHLPEPEVWERLFGDLPAGIYQNGAYWGTASGWMIQAVAMVNPTLAEEIFTDLISSYQENGTLEWISRDGRRGPDLYVATIANVWSLLKSHPQFSRDATVQSGAGS